MYQPPTQDQELLEKVRASRKAVESTTQIVRRLMERLEESQRQCDHYKIKIAQMESRSRILPIAWQRAIYVLWALGVSTIIALTLQRILSA